MAKKAFAYEDDELLLPSEVAALFKVDPKTVARWANGGKIPCIRTPGGQRRIRFGDVKEFLTGSVIAGGAGTGAGNGDGSGDAA